MQTKFINEFQLSELIGIKAPTLRKWRWEGKGPKFVKFGHRVMYNMKDVESYIEAQTRRSTVDLGDSYV